MENFFQRIPATDALRSSVLGGLPQFKYTSSQHKLLNRAVADFLLQDSLPVSVVEGEGFKNLVKNLQPCYALPGRTFFQQVRGLLF